MTQAEKKIFSGKVPVAKPYFTQDEENFLAETIQSGWVAQGPRVKAFEQAIADYVGARYAIAANSCTSALQLALEVSGVGPGDEVIIPSFTFVATANAIIHCGAKPVFADIDPLTYNMDPRHCESLVTSKTKAVMPVDQIGLPADWDAFQNIAGQKKIRLIEDAACGLGSEYKGKKIGGFIDLVCFSFHPRKLITTGEGGMVTTSRPELAEALKVKVSHGASVSDLTRHQSSKVVFEEYKMFGYNFRMSDLQAAVGLAQLKKLDEILQKRRYFAGRYNQTFASMPEIVCPVEPAGSKTNFQSYMIRILPKARKTRDEIMQELLEKGISTRRGIMAIHQEPAFIERFGKFSLPQTEKALEETVILPLYPQMTVEEQDHVIESLKQALVF